MDLPKKGTTYGKANGILVQARRKWRSGRTREKRKLRGHKMHRTVVWDRARNVARMRRRKAGVGARKGREEGKSASGRMVV
jgi:hypothetical protein